MEGDGSTAGDDEPTTVGATPPGAAPGRGSTARARSIVIPGGFVGRYLVLEEIGRGGMGRVLRAYDPKLQREVALKLMLPGTMSTQGRAQLLREARAMARLSHPHVVSVFDIETGDDGVVMLAMELVQGQTLRDWLAEGRRSPSEICEVFVQAGRGLVAAHMEGLVHRDFKPTNVLVSLEARVGGSKGGRSPRARVTDFGVAAPMDRTRSDPSRPPSLSSTDDSIARTESDIVAGTPRYMAPEQHEGQPASAASDQYALCVALWEALCKEPPFTGEDLAQCKRAGAPKWPSAPGVPSHVGDALCRGLEPDPTRRWSSLKALLEELEGASRSSRPRWLAAGAAGTVTTIAAMVAAGAARAEPPCSGAQGRIASVWGEARRAEVRRAVSGSELSYADAVWEHVETNFDAYTSAWADKHVQTCEATTVHAEQSEADMDLRMRCLQRARDELDAAIGLLARGDADIVARAHDLTAGLPPLSRCDDVQALRSSIPPPNERQAERVAEASRQLAMARAATDAARFEEATPLLEAGRSLAEQAGYEPILTEIEIETAYVLDQVGDYEGSQAAYERALGSAMRSHQWRPAARAASQLVFVVGSRLQDGDELPAWVELAQILAGEPTVGAEPDLLLALSAVASTRAEHDKAVDLRRRLLDLQKQTFGPRSRQVAMAQDNLAHSLYELGHYHDAEVEYRGALEIRREVLPDGHPDHALSLDRLASLARVRGHNQEAARLQLESLRVREKALGPDHVHTAASRVNLADAYVAMGDYQRAERELLQGIEQLERALGADHPHIAVARGSLAAVYLSLQRYDEAEAQSRTSLAIRRDAHGDEHPSVGLARGYLASVLQAKHELAAAEEQARLAARIFEASLGPDHLHTATARQNLSAVLAERGEVDQALHESRVALASLLETFGEDHPEAAAARTRIGELLLERGDSEPARQMLERAWHTRQREDLPAHERAQTAFALARALRATGDATRARSLAKQAAGLFEQEAPARAEVLAWLEAGA